MTNYPAPHRETPLFFDHEPIATSLPFRYNDIKSKEDKQMNSQSKKISINNSHSFCEPEEAIASVPWEVIVNLMDDETRETVHNELAPCSDLEFLRRYLEIAPDDLIIG